MDNVISIILRKTKKKKKWGGGGGGRCLLWRRLIFNFSKLGGALNRSRDVCYKRVFPTHPNPTFFFSIKERRFELGFQKGDFKVQELSISSKSSFPLLTLGS